MSRVAKVVAYLSVGATCGAFIGAAILGVSTWFNESSNDIDEKFQWAMVGAVMGAGSGLILGALLGLVVGLVLIIRRRV